MRLQEPPITTDNNRTGILDAELTLTPDEANELAEIVAQFTPAQQERYRVLAKRLEDETLTPTEHEELIALTHHAEIVNVARLTLLVEIGRRRNLKLPQVMTLLEIGPLVS